MRLPGRELAPLHVGSSVCVAVRALADDRRHRRRAPGAASNTRPRSAPPQHVAQHLRAARRASGTGHRGSGRRDLGAGRGGGVDGAVGSLQLRAHRGDDRGRDLGEEGPGRRPRRTTAGLGSHRSGPGRVGGVDRGLQHVGPARQLVLERGEDLGGVDLPPLARQAVEQAALVVGSALRAGVVGRVDGAASGAAVAGSSVSSDSSGASASARVRPATTGRGAERRGGRPNRCGHGRASTGPARASNNATSGAARRPTRRSKAQWRRSRRALVGRRFRRAGSGGFRQAGHAGGSSVAARVVSPLRLIGAGTSGGADGSSAITRRVSALHGLVGLGKFAASRALSAIWRSSPGFARRSPSTRSGLAHDLLGPAQRPPPAGLHGLLRGGAGCVPSLRLSHHPPPTWSSALARARADSRLPAPGGSREGVIRSWSVGGAGRACSSSSRTGRRGRAHAAPQRSRRHHPR
jgi:hypothetical protein